MIHCLRPLERQGSIIKAKVKSEIIVCFAQAHIMWLFLETFQFSQKYSKDCTGIEAASSYGGSVSDRNMLWGSKHDFKLFLSQEQSLHSVEFLKLQTIMELSEKYLVCESNSCDRHGWMAIYMKNNPDWRQCLKVWSSLVFWCSRT